ncbi:MAG: hypothetical protein K2O08_05250 [Clostridia bacterium]|nr:hypothetical protein [Clostridia bacterium]
MAKRSKKKNPNALTQQQKADIQFNKTLDLKKTALDIRLNIALGIVVGLCIIAFLIMPALNMNFSSALSEILDYEIQEAEDDPTFAITVNMSMLDFLTASSGGYEDAIDYISKNTNSSIDPQIISAAFAQKITTEDINMLKDAYTVALIISALWLLSWVVLLCAVCAYRSKNKDGVFLLLSVAAFALVSAIQWIVFVIVGAASAGRAGIQPHIASYLILASAITATVVYGLYRKKIKKINGQRKPVAIAAEDVKSEK